MVISLNIHASQLFFAKTKYMREMNSKGKRFYLDRSFRGYSP